MLFNICLLQIVLYLFLSPIIRVGQGDNTVDYSFGIALLFTLLFIGAGVISKKRKIHKTSLDYQLSLSAIGVAIVSLWALLYIVLSLRHGLINRRIGTHEVAILFSEIPIIDLIAFRSFELILPFLIAYLIIKLINFKLSLGDKILLLCVLGALLFSGVIFSRASLLILLLCAAVILQNTLSRKQLFKLLAFLVLGGVLMFVAVSIFRVLNAYSGDLSEFLSYELLKRTDGLELISLLIDVHGYPLFGVDPSAVMIPIISSIPFLPLANELKASALTTVKSNILAFEFGSPLRDTNSFVIVDVFYWGGVIGLMLSAVFLGFFIMKLDQKILATKSIFVNSLLIAFAGNIIVMERELIGMLIGVARDFVILTLVFLVICKKPKAMAEIVCPINRKFQVL